MATNHRGVPEDRGYAAEVEKHKIGEIRELFNALDILQTSFARFTTPEERQNAEGRRCILAVTGLRFHQLSLFFEVAGAQIRQVQPFEGYTTYIAAPIDSVIRVLKGILEGDEDAFVNEWARGQAKLVGNHSIHDGLQFAEAFRRLARIVKRYKALTASR